MRTRWIATAALAVAALAAGGAAWAKGGGGAKPPATKPLLLAAVSDADGKPVAGADVVILYGASTDMEDRWLPSVTAAAKTDAKGIAAFAHTQSPVCLLAWTEKTAALVCNEPSKAPPESMSVKLGPGRRITGRILGPDGKPVAGTKGRARASGGYEWHHFDAEVAADGSFKLPTLPLALVEQDEAFLEFMAPGVAPLKELLGPDGDDKPLALRFPAPRRVKAHLVGADGRAVAGGVAMTSDWVNGPKSAADAKGVIDFGPLPASVRRIHFLSDTHGDVVVDLPAGDGTTDLGDLKLPAGAPVKGRVLEADGMEIRRAFLALHDADDFRVAKVEINGPAFELPHIGEGEYTLHVYVHELAAAKSWRHIRVERVHAGNVQLDVTMPSGLVVRLEDAAGKPFLAQEVRVSCAFPGKEKPWTETFQQIHGPKFAEIRFGPMPGGPVDVTVTVQGKAPVVVRGVPIDADGCGEMTATIGK